MSRIGFFLGLVLLVGCNKSVAKSDGAPAPAPSASPAAMAQASPSESAVGVLPTLDVVRGVSIYALPSPFVDQDGASSKIDAFRGQITLVAMFFASCPQACPRLINNTKAIEAALTPKEREGLRVLLITIDPENDTPDVLRGVVKRFGLDAGRWKLLTGKDDDIRDAAAVLGVKYREMDGTLNHSSVITLLDREGRIDARYDGIADTRAAASARIRELLAKR
ncbi:MAG: SCO family protein [Myxococcales bacterium]|nr:SCO family protein [Myxococcales bacterium]